MSQLSQFFNPNQKRDTSYNGPKPYGSLLEAEGGVDYKKNIMNRLEGIGVGYGEGYADKNSSPIINNMKNQFSSYQLPELQSQLSAMGRRKGSAGFDQIRRAYQEEGLNEGDVFSRLQQQNDVASHNDINDALAKLGAFNQNDYNARTTASNFYKGLNDDQVRDAAAQRAEGNAAFGRMIGVSTLGLPTQMPQSVTSPSAGQPSAYNSYAPTAMQSFGGNYLDPFSSGQQAKKFASPASSRLKINDSRGLKY